MTTSEKQRVSIEETNRRLRNLEHELREQRAAHRRPVVLPVEGPRAVLEGEEDEAALAEIVEYLRVAAQLAFEELADIRDAGAPPPA